MRAKIYDRQAHSACRPPQEAANNVGDGNAEVTISGRDKTADLIDCSALAEGPAELKGGKLGTAAAKIADPFGLKVRTEVETDAAFGR